MVNQDFVRRAISIGAFIVTGIFVYIYFSQFLPIVLAILTAMIVEPVVRWIKRKLRMEKRIIPVTIVFTTLMLTCALSLYFTLTRVAKSIYEWSFNLPRYVIKIQQSINDFIISFNEFIDEVPQAYLIIAELEKQADGLTNWALQMTSKLINFLGVWLQSIPNTIFVSIFYFITFFLISLDFPRLLNIFYGLFKTETSTKLQYVMQRMGKVFLGYWKAQFILSIGVFVITYISLLFISPNSAFIMSVLIWVIDIIPLYVGPALILVPWGILAIILGNVSTGIQLIILAIVLLILRRVIEPKVLGDSIGLAALPTVLSMYFGFVFFGVMGLILGPFVYIAIRSAMEAGLFDFKWKKEETKEIEAEDR